ncbi:MAG: glycosyltransferase [Prevotella sp.]|nr:glycosyltransferase [Prevotella sp.]
MIKFSIVTCTFNAATVVGRTLDSIRHQTYPYVEHLILDGKSTDSTLQLVRAYQTESDEAETEHEIIVVSESDSGLYDAMNKGIGMATGDYIVFLNAGDVLPSENTLEFIAGSVGDGEQLPGVLYGDTDIVDMTGRFLRYRRLYPPKEGLSWRSFSNGMLVCHQAFYARTDLAKRVLYNLNYRFSADVDWCIRIMKEAEQQQLPLKHVGAVIVNYLDGGMTTKNHQASLQERFNVMRHHYGLPMTLWKHFLFVFRAIFKK